MRFEKRSFGSLPSGEAVSCWILESNSLVFSLIDYGAAWHSIVAPGRNGKTDVILGFDTFEEWHANTMFMNATIGRFANRIAGGRFTLNGAEYTLDRNEGENCLHSGRKGFHNMLWKGTAFSEQGGIFVRFERTSPPGEGGFPGLLNAAVTYGLCEENTISAEYTATLDSECPLSFTNHAYFNLAGTGSVLSHELRLFSSTYAELDRAGIPSGRLLSAANSPFDFQTKKPIGRDIDAALLSAQGGYDHPFTVDGNGLRPAAEVSEPVSGRRLTVRSTQPALHFIILPL
jgi:aldose 1-epimerase